jgi:hypothetical protein
MASREGGQVGACRLGFTKAVTQGSQRSLFELDHLCHERSLGAHGLI